MRGVCDTKVTRAIDNRPMSSRSQALFRSITEVKHVLRQINQHSRRSFPLFSGLWMVLEIPLAWLAGIALGWERRCQYKQLLELDDRLRADMGLSRTTVEEVRRSPLYLIAWRDSR